jgi:NAD(P)H-dependent FMN reductase
MTDPLKILAFAGSARADSLNKKLIRAASRAAEDAGGAVTLVDLDDFPMPVYHGDVEARDGIPPHARRFRELLATHHALLIASPENNGSVSSLLKTTLDWASRPDGGQNGLAPYQGKVAALLAASPGALGGLRGLVHLRQILMTLNVLVLTEQVAVPRAHEAFGEDGALKDVRLQTSVAGLARRLVDVGSRLAP